MISELITNVGVIAGLTIIGCEYLTKLTKAEGTWAQVQAWGISIVLAWLASFLGIGIFPNVSIISVILYGFLVGLVFLDQLFRNSDSFRLTTLGSLPFRLGAITPTLRNQLDGNIFCNPPNISM